MDRELIERLAVEAGVCYSLGERPGELAFAAFEDDAARDVLCRFAALVADECIRLCDEKGGGWPLNGPETVALCKRAIREAFKA